MKINSGSILNLKTQNIFTLNKSKVLFYYLILFSPILFLLKNLSFVSDDYLLIKSAINNVCPLINTWGFKNTGYYRPVVIFSFYLNYVISKYQPFLYYLFNFFIHVINSFLLVLVLREFLDLLNKRNALTISFWGGVIFLILPQNILNVLWISGRTDLICGFFSFLSLYLIVKFIKSNKNIFLIFSLISCILAYMSKETAIIINLYIVFIFIIFRLNKIKFDYKKIVIPYFCITALYLIFHTSLFQLPQLFKRDIYGIVPLLSPKFYIYGLWDLFIPISILDLIYFFSESSFIFYLIIFLLLTQAIILSFFVKKYLNSYKKKILLLSLFVLLSSFFIYYSYFPQMRLLYMHYAIFLLGAFSINFQKEFRICIKLSIFIPIALFIIYGNYLVIYRTISVDKYYKQLIRILPPYNQYKEKKKIYFLTPLARVSESLSDPSIEAVASIKYKIELKKKYSKFCKLAFYEGYSLSNIGNYIEYTTKKNSIYVNIRNKDGIVPIPSKKFNNTMVYDDVRVKFIEFQRYRPGFASKVVVEFKNSSALDSCQIIYFKKGELKLNNLKQFLRIYESN